MNEKKLSFAAVALSVSLAHSAFAQDATGGLASHGAVEIAVQNNPSLHIALLQETQAGYAVTAENALYDPIFDANGSVAHNRSPSLRGTDGTIVSTSDVVNLGASLTKTFATGTSVQAAVSGQRRVSASPPINNVGGTNAVGPAYSLVGQLTLTQPFLRGYGNALGLASLRVARFNRTAATLAAQQTGSQVLHDVLGAYWELWYASEVVRIDEASRDLAKALQNQADEQVKSGTLANVDALPYRTQTAQQEGLLDSANTDVRQKGISLALAIGRDAPAGSELKSVDTPPEVATEDLGERAVDEALAASYELKQLQLQLQIAQDQAKIAGDSLRPQLNLQAVVSAQGLGNRQVPPAFEQFGRMEAVSASVGLTFETPVTDTRRSAQVESALIGVHLAEKQIENLRLQLKSNLRSALAQHSAAARRLELALVTEKVAQDQADGVQGKFQAGTALAIEVQKASNDYQGAQLNVRRARVDLVESEIELLHQRGKLLDRYADVLKSYKPTALILKGANEPM